MTTECPEVAEGDHTFQIPLTDWTVSMMKPGAAFAAPSRTYSECLRYEIKYHQTRSQRIETEALPTHQTKGR